MISSENGTIVIKNNCTLGSDSKILCKITPEAVRESKVVIGENVHFLEKMAILSENGTIIIGNNCTLFPHFRISATCGGVVHIGDRCTFQDYCWMSVCFGAKLRFGQDCMVSYFVLTRAGNGHNIIDLNTGVNLDDNSKRDILLGEHVWVGMRVMLLSGAVIGSGSIIGANSFVNKEFPCNCCLAGNPARVIKERTAWIRERMKLNKNMEDYENYIFG